MHTYENPGKNIYHRYLNVYRMGSPTLTKRMLLKLQITHFVQKSL